MFYLDCIFVNFGPLKIFQKYNHQYQLKYKLLIINKKNKNHFKIISNLINRKKRKIKKIKPKILI